MREEVKTILEMQSQGKISCEQAADLIMALKEKENPSPGENFEERHSADDAARTVKEYTSLGDLVSHILESAITKGKIAPFEGKFGRAKIKFNSSTGNNNNVSASNVEPPQGFDFEFEDNQISLSNLTDLRMESSAFRDNSVRASTLRSIEMEHSARIEDTSFSGSSIDGLTMSHGSLTDCQFNGCKWSDCRIIDSEISDGQFDGSSMKGLVVSSDSSIEDFQWRGSAAANTRIESCQLADIQINGTQFSECTWQNVKLSDTSITNCRFTNCSIKNVELSDAQLSGVDFSNKEFDGQAEFESFLNSHSG